jgi:hypothetical protein
MNSRTSIIPMAAIVAAVLSGCGGGGDSSSGSPQQNAFSAMVGSYAVACDGNRNGNAINNTGSADGSVSIDGLAGSDRAQVTARLRQYSDSSCSTGALVTDITVKGEIRDLNATKDYALLGGTVTAKVVEFTYTGLTISKGSISGSLPTFGVTTRMAYYLNGNKLYLSKGVRGADGLGATMSANAGVKQ